MTGMRHDMAHTLHIFILVYIEYRAELCRHFTHLCTSLLHSGPQDSVSRMETTHQEAT